MQGQHHDRHVDAHPVQLGRAKRAQVDRGVLPHAEPVEADHPGPVVPARGPRHPGVRRPVGLVLEPPRPAGLLGIRLPPAREGGVLVAQPVGGLVDRPYVVGRRGVAVVGRRVVDPPPDREDLAGNGQVGGGRDVVLFSWQQVRVPKGGDQDLVEVRLGGQRRRRPHLDDAVVVGDPGCAPVAADEEVHHPWAGTQDTGDARVTDRPGYPRDEPS